MYLHSLQGVEVTMRHSGECILVGQSLGLTTSRVYMSI